MPKPTDPKDDQSAADFVRRVKAEREAKSGFDYRRAALAVLPHVCARCGRDFEAKDLPLLTVHHRDGDHDNNPRDGGNWELLCVYCHENEHSREVLADRIAPAESVSKPPEKGGTPMVSLADKLKAALEKKK